MPRSTGERHRLISLMKHRILKGSCRNRRSYEKSWSFREVSGLKCDIVRIFYPTIFQVNGAIMVIYEDPQYPEGFIFPAKRLENAKEIPRALRDYSDRRVSLSPKPYQTLEIWAVLTCIF